MATLEKRTEGFLNEMFTNPNKAHKFARRLIKEWILKNDLKNPLFIRLQERNRSFLNEIRPRTPLQNSDSEGSPGSPYGIPKASFPAISSPDCFRELYEEARNKK